MSALEDLLAEIDVALENTYMDPLSRVWLTRVVNTLEAEGWTKTTPAQQKFAPGPGQTTFLSEDGDISPLTSSKDTTSSIPTDLSVTATPSEG